MRTFYATPEIESMPYEQKAAHGYARGKSEKCVRCARGLYCEDQSEEGERVPGAWCSFCGAPEPLYVFDGQTVDPNLRSLNTAISSSTPISEPARSPDSENLPAVNRNAPGRKKLHSSNADRQRAYRDRNRRAARDR